MMSWKAPDLRTAAAREGALPRQLHLPRAGAGPLVGALVAEARELHLGHRQR